MVRRGATLILGAALVLGACSGDDDDSGGGTPILQTVPGASVPESTTPNGEPAREGDYVEVASDESGGVAWTLSQAPASGEGVCWKLDVEPELDLVIEAEHCSSPVPSDQVPLAMLVDFPYATGITTDHDLVI